MKNRLLLPIILAAVITATFSSCKKDEPVPPSSNGQPIAAGDGVFITNEGNFQGGNAMVSFYRFSNGTAIEDLFRPVNSRPLGDVCQSVSFINGNVYVVVNNSGKIEVCTPSNLRSTKTITGFVSPRYILPVAGNKAYVTDLYSNAVHIVDLSNNTVTGSFAFPGQAEAIALTNGEVYITCLNRDKVYVVDPNSDMITDSIQVAMGGNSLQVDNNGKLWELCYGDYVTSSAGGLYRINTSTHMVEQGWPFTTFDFPTKLCANSTGDTLYYLNYNIYRFPSSASAAPSSAFISATTQSFYGLGIRPGTGEVFVTDAVDYTQRGHLLRYTAAGILEDDEQVGIIPGGIWFY
jgi:hypothetical protein